MLVCRREFEYDATLLSTEISAVRIRLASMISAWLPIAMPALAASGAKSGATPATPSSISRRETCDVGAEKLSEPMAIAASMTALRSSEATQREGRRADWPVPCVDAQTSCRGRRAETNELACCAVPRWWHSNWGSTAVASARARVHFCDARHSRRTRWDARGSW